MFKGENKVREDNPERLNRMVSGTKLTGDIVTQSSLRIDGEVNGNVVCKGRLVIGKEGKIIGDVIAAEIEMNGTIEGQIKAEVLLSLYQTAIVRGDIQTERLVIEDGAQIEGYIHAGTLPPKSSNSNSSSKATPQEDVKSDEKHSDVVY